VPLLQHFGLPIVLTALTAIGLGFLIHDAILIPLFMVFVGIILWALNRSVNNQALSKTGAFSPFKLASIGAVISVIGLVLSVAGVPFATVLIYAGLVMFFGANVWVHQAHVEFLHLKYVDHDF
jgi:mercuric ion transport protein